MANPEHVEMLKRSVEEWNTWRAEHPKEVPDLHEADLFGADLSMADLSGAKLIGANLSGATLFKADLNSGATFDRSDLSGADLSKADFSGAFMAGANFSEADLAGATLLVANLRDATLVDANLRDADLRRAVLSGADLSRADLSNSYWGSTSFQSTNLSNAVVGEVRFEAPCGLDPETVLISGGLPESFLQGCGWPERLIDYWPSIAGTGIELYSGFISYAHADPDKSFARRLHDGLQGKGIRVWRDEHELNPGDSIMAEIDRGIRLWDKTLLCCSKASLTSWWVLDEIERALEKERRIYKDRGESVLAFIPLDLDGYLLDGWKHEYATVLKKRLAADFTGWETDNAKFEAQFEKVVRAMTVGGAKPPPPEPKL